MEDFSNLLQRDYGLRPQGKSAPMGASKGTYGSNFNFNPNGRSSSVHRGKPLHDVDDVFSSNQSGAADFNAYDGLYGGPQKSTNPSSHSTTGYDDIFNSFSAPNSKPSSVPVYDALVYDEDIFGGVQGVKSASATVTYDDVFKMRSASPSPSPSPASFEDLFGELGKTKAPVNLQPSGDDALSDDLIPGFGNTEPARPRYPKMRDALLRTGHPIFYSLCEWGRDHPATWGAKVGNNWRTTQDINNSWISIASRVDLNDKWAHYAGPGGWNDPDMLEVGNGKLNREEYRSHFSLWALMKTPLLIGCDVRSMSPGTFEILSNAEVIAVNQDPLGIQGRKVYSNDNLEVWAGPLSNNRMVIILLNKKESRASITARWEDIELQSSHEVQLRNLWKHKYLASTYRGSLTSSVKPHACKMYILTSAYK